MYEYWSHSFYTWLLIILGVVVVVYFIVRASTDKGRGTSDREVSDPDSPRE